jgi:L-amino acid N-acyltransferase YncA
VTAIRVAKSRDEVESYVSVWNTVTPEEPAFAEQQWERLQLDPRRLYLLAEHDGGLVGCGFAGASDSPGRGFVSPRVLPDARGRGVGSALLQRLCDHLARLEFELVSAHVDGNDPGSLAFAERHGFAEADRQVEQVKQVGDEPAPRIPDGVRFVTIAEQPELLREAHELGLQGWADMATTVPVTISLVRRARRGRDRRLLRALSAAGRRRRGRPHRRTARLASAWPRARAEAGGARLGECERDRGDRHLDAARQRWDARRQRAARLRVPQCEHHRPQAAAAGR